MKTRLVILSAIVLFSSFVVWQQQRPVLYIIGDSTVKNGSGGGSDGLWGWGTLIGKQFDTTRISVENHAIGGRSSRTFITDGRWDRILERLKPGDYVIMQFGHNDGGALDDTSRARGTIKGTGDESKDIYNPIRKVNEVVYTYGYYMRKYVNDSKAKGAIPIICSPIPRNTFVDGKINRNENYALWSKEVAGNTGAYFIPLHTLVCDRYDVLGADSVKNFFPKDHTHPNLAGSELNAGLVVQGIKDLKSCDLKKYVK
jgi:rhamnogalacturonan acetylesterase